MLEAGYTRQLGKNAHRDGARLRQPLPVPRLPGLRRRRPRIFRDLGDSTWYGRRGARALRRPAQGAARRHRRRRGHVRPSAEPQLRPADESVDADPDQASTSQGVYAEAETSPSSGCRSTGGVRFDRQLLFSNPARRARRCSSTRTRTTASSSSTPRASAIRARSRASSTTTVAAPPTPTSSRRPSAASRSCCGAARAPACRCAARASTGASRTSSSRRRSCPIPAKPNDTRIQNANIFALRSTGVEVEGLYRDAVGWLGYASATVAYVGRIDPGGPSSFMGDHALTTNAPEVVAAAGVEPADPEAFSRVDRARAHLEPPHARDRHRRRSFPGLERRGLCAGLARR